VSINKKGGLVIFSLGILSTLIFYYIFLDALKTPDIMKNIMKSVNNITTTKYDITALENQFKQILSEHYGLEYLVLQNPEGENMLDIRKTEEIDEQDILELRRNVEDLVLKAGFNKKVYYKKTAGPSFLLFGIGLTLILAFTASVFIKGLADKLQLISAYLKESDIADIDELVKEEEWPPEIRRLVASIEILLKKIEKNLKVKIEEAKRDKLFAHNSIVGLVDCLDKVSQGDLRVRATATPDMVGALGEAFNDAMASLGERIGKIRKLITQMEEMLQDDTPKVNQVKECLERLNRILDHFSTEP
jgi:methyl-accepting chemotaxis protein